ncbi:glycosyltransferase [Deefgea tanakiae]|uniref:Glycosyltransferase n=1 Tax=Deefgea tanakiae TaxID=2865840 RepID=A0ABX8Z6U6_9NEIS|nr:glycosyltransferase [Deefgea tanakiae]QZA78312.1 glycosyltransferase [Deefgea tanakiae]
MKVSILVAAYNAEAFIVETIQSVLQQTFTDWELIIVDDGSNDATAEIVAHMINQDARIKLFKQRNSGAQIARNFAFSASQGQYIVFLDADDRILPAKLALQVELLDSNPDFGLVYGDTWHCDSKMNRLKLESQKNRSTGVMGDVFEEIIKNNIMSVHSAMVRRVCLEDVGVYDSNPQLIADWDLWVRIASKYSFLFNPQPVAEYRIHDFMSAKTDAGMRQIKQRYGVSSKIKLMSRYAALTRRKKAMLDFSDGRFAINFGFRKVAAISYVQTIKLNCFFWRAYFALFFSLFGK